MKFDKTDIWGFEHAIRSMRNPLNSWHKSDSGYCWDRDKQLCIGEYGKFNVCTNGDSDCFCMGKNDLNLAQNLVLAGSEHAKFMRMIHVAVDIDMPRYWWSEADTYKFNSKNSCSTMHKLLSNEIAITKDLFTTCKEDDDVTELVVGRLEEIRSQYKLEKDFDKQTRLLIRAKRLLMEGFLQLRTFDTNYAELRNMYFQRKRHRLKEEWVDVFCKWVESLPYSKELITIEGE